MLKENIYYQEEKIYSRSRLIVLIVASFLTIMIYQQTSDDLAIKALYIAFVLVSLTSISIAHYFFMLRFPTLLLGVRKALLIFMDLMALTYLIIQFEEHGLFLLPLYIIIVMRNGFSLGIGYFYISIALAAISWTLLLIYSPYWKEHTDIIATFAVTTLLLPLFYLKYISSVHEKNNELSEVLVTTKHDANYDTLTGISNRKMYKEYMKKSFKNREPFALFFIDLNKFKIINDTYGHDIGDKVLQESVRRLNSVIDSEDFIARLGGDEFVIITKRKKAFLKKFVENMEDKVIGKYSVDDVTVTISLSIGISLFPDDSVDEMILSKYADEAMYKAKKNPNTYHHFHNDETLSESKSKNWI